MDATNNISTDLFYKIRSRFTGLKLGEATGQITINPETARFFDFDYMENDKNIGHVSISLAEPNSMKVYFSSGITEGMDTDQKHNWYGFLKELRMFAKRRLLAFDTRDIAKDNLDKRDYAFLSQHSTPQSDNDTITKPVGEAVMNESNLYGTKTQSFQKLMDTRLIIKHSKKLADDFEQKPGDRSRNISALFVENQDGERFKYPFIHLAGARVMQRHVANGGLPYDAIGESIIKMSEEIAQLKSFTNYCVRNDLMNSDTNSIVERSKAQLDGLRERIARLSKQAHYENYVAEFQAPEAVEVPDDVMEEYKEKFTVKNFKEDIANAFPIIYKLMKEEETIGYDDIVGNMNEGGVKQAEIEVQDWFEKFNEYKGTNGDDLAQGWIRATLDTGIMADAYEEDELEAFNKMKGYKGLDADWQDGDHADFTSNKSGASPITAKMFSTINAIMDKYGIDEEQVDDMSKANDPSYDKPVKDGFANFENWVNQLGEESPLTMADDEQKADMIKKLNGLLNTEFQAGVEGINAITSLEGIIEDPKLEQDIKKAEPEQDVRPMVKAWVEENAPDVLGELDFGDMADEPAVGADEVEPQQEDMSKGFNKYGLAAVYKSGKFFSIKDNKITGEFDSIEELKKHQEELLNKTEESEVAEGGNAWDLAVTTGMEIIQDCDDAEECIKRLEDEITGSNEPDESYADAIYKDYIEKIKTDGFDKVRHEIDSQEFHGDIAGDIMDMQGQTNENMDHKDLIGDLETCLDGAKEGNDMADFIADELGDYIRSGIEDMGEEEWQDSLAGRALAELDNCHLEGPEAQVKSCQKALDVLKQNEGNEFAQKVRQMKAAGAKKGTKFKTSDGEEHTLEGLAEFIKSFYDKNTGTFPKGPEGVATMVGKKFGEQAEQVARKMVERMAPAQEQGAEELERIKELVRF